MLLFGTPGTWTVLLPLLYVFSTHIDDTVWSINSLQTIVYTGFFHHGPMYLLLLVSLYRGLCLTIWF